MIAERDGYVQTWHADISAASSRDATGKLSDARQSLNKAQLHRQLVELRADSDGTVLTVAQSLGRSVLQAGQQFITLVPADAPLGDRGQYLRPRRRLRARRRPGAIKFDTFPLHAIRHGLRHGANHQRRQLHRSGRPAEPDQLACRCPATRTNRITGPASPSTASTCAARRRVSTSTPGMPVTADIKVGKRTVLAYLLGRVVARAHGGHARAVSDCDSGSLTPWLCSIGCSAAPPRPPPCAVPSG